MIARDVLSSNGNIGEFDFNYVDENGNPVSTGTYAVVALVDDSAHDIVTVVATGRLNIIN